jgi:hypothetical protein
MRRSSCCLEHFGRRVAADLGYADQAQMMRDCLRLSGLTPVQLAELWTS